MIKVDTKTSLMKIEVYWENITKEKSDDLDAYDYIASTAMSLKMTAFQLKDSIENQMLKDKTAKLKLQKLHKALNNIVRKLDFRYRVDKNTEYIEGILNMLSLAKQDIETIRQHQQILHNKTSL